MLNDNANHNTTTHKVAAQGRTASVDAAVAEAPLAPVPTGGDPPDQTCSCRVCLAPRDDNGRNAAGRSSIALYA